MENAIEIDFLHGTFVLLDCFSSSGVWSRNVTTKRWFHISNFSRNKILFVHLVFILWLPSLMWLDSLISYDYTSLLAICFPILSYIFMRANSRLEWDRTYINWYSNQDTSVLGNHSFVAGVLVQKTRIFPSYKCFKRHALNNFK